MLGIDDAIEGPVIAGIAVVAGAVVLAPILAPALLTAARPLVKTAIRTGIVLYGQGREKLSEAGEALEDILAEVKAELEAAAPIIEEAAVDVAEAASEGAA